MGILVKRSDDLFKENASGGYTYEETIADGVTSDPILLKPAGRGGTPISVSVIAGSNTGKIQTTISSLDKVIADTATWIDWDKGDVTGTQIDVLMAQVTAIRGVSVSGEIKIEFLI